MPVFESSYMSIFECIVLNGYLMSINNTPSKISGDGVYLITFIRIIDVQDLLKSGGHPKGCRARGDIEKYQQIPY